MNPARQTFINAARNGTLFHLCTHLEQALKADTEILRRVFGQANAVAVLMQEINAPNLAVTFKSDSTIPFVEVATRSPSFSAWENQAIPSYVKMNNKKVGLVSGVEVSQCIPKTIEHMLRANITPIAITDAIDFNQGIVEEANAFWGDEVLSATVEDIQAWAADIST